jgi:hypothetical protein
VVDRNLIKVLERELTPTERERNFIYVATRFLEHFPTNGESFQLSIGDEILETYIDKSRRLLLGRFRDRGLRLSDPNTIVFVEKELNTNMFYLVVA